jgi:hypothetical protein
MIVKGQLGSIDWGTIIGGAINTAGGIWGPNDRNNVPTLPPQIIVAPPPAPAGPSTGTILLIAGAALVAVVLMKG